MNERALRTAWLAVALLWPVAFLNYLDRQMLASMKSSVMADLPDIGRDANWGLMLGQFKWVYAALSPLGGLLADRVGRRPTIVLSLAAWSAVTLLTAHVHDYRGLLWTRTAMGLSEAFYIPAALALIADAHAQGTRARAVGLHQTAIYLGVIAGGFGGYVADAPGLGWRFAFQAAGLVGLAYAVPLFLFLREPPRVATLPKAAPGTALALLRNPSFLLLVAYFTLPALAGWVVRDWMPAILKDRFAIGQGLAGVSATLYVNVAALVAVFAGGWISDRLMRRTVRGRILVSAAGMALLIPSIFGVGDAPTLGVAIGFLALFGIGWGLFDGQNMPIPAGIARPEARATGYGLMNLVSIGCGGFADWGFGVLRDRHVPLDAIFAAFAALLVLSLVLVLLIRPLPEFDAS